MSKLRRVIIKRLLSGSLRSTHPTPSPGIHAHHTCVRWKSSSGVGLAAHEAEEVADPVGHAEPEHFSIERYRPLDVRGEEGDMPELERADTGDLRVLGQVAPVLEQIDGGSLVVLERQHLAHAGN